jgi:hypothetical protein
MNQFQPGDPIVLTLGTYQGTPGVFVCLRQDTKWADVRESDGAVRSHPVAWLGAAGSPLGQLVSERQ